MSGIRMQRLRFWAFWGGVIALVALLSVALFWRLQHADEAAASEKKHVLTTFTVLADMAQNVAGDAAKVSSLTKVGAEIHGYEPTPQDMVRAQEADIILDNGMNLEKWAAKLYENAPDVPHVTISKGITSIPIAEGPYHNKPNPHAWMSPANALKYVDNIAAALSDVDPTNSAIYHNNAKAYKKQIKTVDKKLTSQLKPLAAAKRYLVSCEGAFSYLVRDYHLNEIYLWPINADSQGTPQQIKNLVETVRQQDVPAVFCESTVSDKAQRQVAKETGAHFGGVFYVDSLSAPDGKVPTYLGLLQYNADTLIKGLRHE